MILSAMTDILVHGVFSYFVLVHGFTAAHAIRCPSKFKA